MGSLEISIINFSVCCQSHVSSKANTRTLFLWYLGFIADRNRKNFFGKRFSVNRIPQQYWKTFVASRNSQWLRSSVISFVCPNPPLRTFQSFMAHGTVQALKILYLDSSL